MIAVVKALMLAFAVSGVAVTGVAAGVSHLPMQKAIDIHKNHLGQNTTMPDQSLKGQQNALDHLVHNQERWVATNHTAEPDHDMNETEAPETH